MKTEASDSFPSIPSLLVHSNSQPTKDASNFFCLFHQSVEARLIKIADIKCYVELRTDFGTRCLGGRKKQMKLTTPAALEPFRDVRHDGNRRALNLTAQPKILCKGTLPRHLVDGSGELTRLLPRNQVFESLNLCHFQILILGAIHDHNSHD